MFNGYEHQTQEDHQETWEHEANRTEGPRVSWRHAEDAPALENGIINYLVDHPTYIQSVDDQPQL